MKTAGQAISGDATLAWPTLASAPPVIGAPGGGGGASTVEATPGGVIGGPNGAAPAGAGSFQPTFLLLMLGMIVLMVTMTVLQGRREKKARAELLSSLGRHDRVQTIGGLIGTIMEIRDDEVVLKVDESNNTRIHVARSAVQAVLKKRSTGEAASGARSEESEPAGVGTGRS